MKTTIVRHRTIVRKTPESLGRIVRSAGVSYFTLIAAFILAGCQTASKPLTGGTAAVAPSMVLAAGDVLRIIFPGAPELNQAQKIRPDGKIGLPLIGEVEAAGATLSSLQDTLSRQYKPKLQNSTVVVGLETTAAAVYISGAVNKPGKVLLERPMTAFEAIMEAGGFTPGLANPKKVILVRKEGGQHQTQFLDLSPTLRDERTEAIYLRPYDVLVIPERMF